MRLFIDANVLVCVLNKELPRFTDVARVLSLAHQKVAEKNSRQILLFTTPLCLAIAFYFASKKHGEAVAKKKIDLLVQNTGIAVIDKSSVSKAMNDKRVEDVEDGFQYYAALKAGCDRLITYDVSDFYFSEIPVMQPEELLYALKGS
jgi:predicted nucleic acid-binding protein